MNEQKTFVIYWHGNYGDRDLIGTTNNPNKWIIEHNKERERDGSNKEKLSDFEIIETTNFNVYEK